LVRVETAFLRTIKAVIPDGAQRRSGIQNSLILLDSRVRGNDSGVVL
jgi:hypothetical protein